MAGAAPAAVVASAAVLGLVGEFRPLYKYLDERFARTVVLTFDEIEDLLGRPLPPAARSSAEWWGVGPTGSMPTAQGQAWTRAQRSAVPNMGAGTVTFERSSER